jgi:hypothetical protein
LIPQLLFGPLEVTGQVGRRYFRVAERKIFVDIKTKVPQYLEHDAR